MATISAKHVYEIAKAKQQDTKDVPLESVCRNITGTCRSRGVRKFAKWKRQHPEEDACTNHLLPGKAQISLFRGCFGC